MILVFVIPVLIITSGAFGVELNSSSFDCGDVKVVTDPLVINYKYYCDGVLVPIIGLFGLIGNITSIIVLARPRMIRDTFHKLLLCLACVDTIYIICGGISYTSRALEFGSDTITLAFPYFIYPFTYIAMSGSIFMTVAISIERFLGICFPLHLPADMRKSWHYILPVLILTLAFNIPKFLEGEINWREDRPTYMQTQLRFKSDYIKYYVMWGTFFITAVIPVLTILSLNIKIVMYIRNAKVQIQRFRSQNQLGKELNIFFILL